MLGTPVLAQTALAAALLALLALETALLELLGRACGERRNAPRRLLRCLAIGLPLLVLAPWLDARSTLLPTSVLAATLPGLPAELRAPELDAYGTQLNDVVLQLAPWEREVRRAFGAGRLPFWSDTLDGGSNLWGNPQAGVLSPVALLARLLPWRYFLLAGLALKLSLAFSGAVLLARRLGARAPAALIAGLAFALGGAIFAWALFPLSTAVAWVPWFSAALVRLLRRPSPAALTATGIGGAALLLSGHPEVAFAGALFALGLAALVRRRGDGRGRRALAAALGCVLAAGLAAPGWLPFVLLIPGSQRLHERLAPPLESTAQWATELRPFLAATLDGEAFGRPYGSVTALWPVSMMPFSGRATALMALAGATLARRRRGLHAALLLVPLGLLLLAPARSAPGLLALPATSRFLPVGDLALALAAALGFEALLRRARVSFARAAVRVALGAAILAAAAWALAPPIGTAARTALWLPVAALARWAIAPCAGAAPRARWQRAWPLLLWIGTELLLWDRTLLPRGDSRLFFPDTPVLETVASLAGPRHRAVGQHLLIPASLLPAYGIGDIRPHNPLAPAAVLLPLRVAFGFAPDPQRYFGEIGGLDHPLLSFLDVGAVVSNAFLPAPAGLERAPLPAASQTGGARAAPDVLWRTLDPVGPLFLASGVDRVAADGLADWFKRLRDPRRVAVDPAEAGETGPVDRATENARAIRSDVGFRRWLPGDVTLAVGGSGRRLLASSLPGPLGWSAEDGTGVALHTVRVNGAYLGVQLPADVGAVRLRFRPPGVRAGSALAVASLLVLAGAWQRHRPRGRDGRPKPWPAGDHSLTGSEYSRT